MKSVPNSTSLNNTLLCGAELIRINDGWNPSTRTSDNGRLPRQRTRSYSALLEVSMTDEIRRVTDRVILCINTRSCVMKSMTGKTHPEIRKKTLDETKVCRAVGWSNQRRMKSVPHNKLRKWTYSYSNQQNQWRINPSHIVQQRNGRYFSRPN